MRARSLGAAWATLAVGLLVGCGQQQPLSQFALDEPATGRVLENITACVVDATCLLRIEFADTVVEAVYGAGERPAPACVIPREVSDSAFAAEQGDIIEAELTDCPGEGYVLQGLRPVETEPGP